MLPAGAGVAAAVPSAAAAGASLAVTGAAKASEVDNQNPPAATPRETRTRARNGGRERKNQESEGRKTVENNSALEITVGGRKQTNKLWHRVSVSNTKDRQVNRRRDKSRQEARRQRFKD